MVWIQSLAQELPHVTGVAKKKVPDTFNNTQHTVILFIKNNDLATLILICFYN